MRPLAEQRARLKASWIAGIQKHVEEVEPKPVLWSAKLKGALDAAVKSGELVYVV